MIVIPNIIYQEHSEQKYHEAVASTLTTCYFYYC
jgi:hypothetical protein